MSKINQELQHQVEVMRAQKDIELSGPVEQVNNYIQALSRIYEIAEEVDAITARLEQLEQIAAAADSSDFKATLNPNPNWEAENQFKESIEKDKANLTQEELDRRVEDFVLEYGLFGFKTAERLKVVLKEVQQKEIEK